MEVINLNNGLSLCLHPCYSFFTCNDSYESAKRHRSVRALFDNVIIPHLPVVAQLLNIGYNT